MRKWLYNQLINDPVVTAFAPVENILSSGAFNIEAPQQQARLVIIRGEAEALRGPQLGKSWNWGVWCHDVPGSYVAIDDILRHLRISLVDAAPYLDDEWRITACEWLGDSPDLVDPDKTTVVRYGTYRITGRPVG
jgi:hypothetical protein